MREFSGGEPDFAEDICFPSVPDLLSKSVLFSALLFLTSVSTEEKIWITNHDWKQSDRKLLN
jgi:hypothetical protein